MLANFYSFIDRLWLSSILSDTAVFRPIVRAWNNRSEGCSTKMCSIKLLLLYKTKLEAMLENYSKPFSQEEELKGLSKYTDSSYKMAYSTNN